MSDRIEQLIEAVRTMPLSSFETGAVAAAEAHELDDEQLQALLIAAWRAGVELTAEDRRFLGWADGQGRPMYPEPTTPTETFSPAAPNVCGFDAATLAYKLLRAEEATHPPTAACTALWAVLEECRPDIVRAARNPVIGQSVKTETIEVREDLLLDVIDAAARVEAGLDRRVESAAP